MGFTARGHLISLGRLFWRLGILLRLCEYQYPYSCLVEIGLPTFMLLMLVLRLGVAAEKVSDSRKTGKLDVLECQDTDLIWKSSPW
jgi:hypothetical protein